MKFRKAVLVNISEATLDQKYWDKIDELVESKVLIGRDDPYFLNELADCDCLMLGFQVPTGKEIFDASPNLKLVNVLATAYGTIDLDAAKKRGIPVCNLGEYSTEAVAEFTIAILLNQMRQLEEGVKRGRAGNFDESGLATRELKGSKFGVIGLGNIGNRVAELAAGFGANVSYWSRTKKDSPFSYKELAELLADSDYISLNIAQTAETTKFLNEQNIPLIKSGAVVVNTVPPEVVDFDALAARLAKNDMVYVSDHGYEMSAEDREKVVAFSNCLLLPALAYITAEARTNKQEIFIANLEAALQGAPQNKVN